MLAVVRGADGKALFDQFFGNQRGRFGVVLDAEDLPAGFVHGGPW
ncbi:hypothetical protein ACU4GD_30570 [Cupriavidus basilensis]